MVRADFPFNVSRETFCRLKGYEDLVKEWQKKINLVSRETLEMFWHWHIVDSAQIFPLINPKEPVIDLGSGAGFPGLVLSILGIPQVTLVESCRKKTSFLREARRVLNADVQIYEGRIETMPLTRVSTITSRALTSVEGLLEYAYRIIEPQTELVFFKGKKSKEEIKEAQKKWTFNFIEKPSITSPEGSILIITGVRRKNEACRGC